MTTTNPTYSCLVWLGDLNYRINLPEPEIKSRLRQNELEILVDYDQVSLDLNGIGKLG